MSSLTIQTRGISPDSPSPWSPLTPNIHSPGAIAGNTDSSEKRIHAEHFYEELKVHSLPFISNQKSLIQVLKIVQKVESPAIKDALTINATFWGKEDTELGLVVKTMKDYMKGETALQGVKNTLDWETVYKANLQAQKALLVHRAQSAGTKTQPRPIERIFRTMGVTSSSSNTPIAVGAPFQIASSYVEDSLVRTLSNGNVVVTWGQYDPKKFHFSVYTQIFHPDGTTVNSPSVVNTIVTTDQHFPGIATLSNGNYFIVWAGKDAKQFSDVYARLYGPDGAPLAIPFKVNGQYDTPYMTFRCAAAASQTNDHLGVTWTAEAPPGARAGTKSGVYLKIFDSTGTQVIKDSFQVYPAADSPIGAASIAALANGNFVITFAKNLSNGGDIYGIILDSNGNIIQNVFPITTQMVRSSGESTITALSNGNFVVVWSRTQPTADTCVRIFDSNGTPLGNEFVADSQSGGGDTPIVSATANGFVVVWNGGSTAVPLAYGQAYDTTGNPIGDNFALSNDSSNRQSFTSVTGLSNGNFWAMWGTSTTAVYGRLFTWPSVTSATPSLTGTQGTQSGGTVGTSSTPSTIALSSTGVNPSQVNAAASLSTGTVGSSSSPSTNPRSILSSTGVNQSQINPSVLVSTSSVSNLQPSVSTTASNGSSQTSSLTANSSTSCSPSEINSDHGPDLKVGGNSPTFTISQGGIIIDGQITVTSNQVIMGAEVAITNNFVSGQDQLLFTNQNGISGNYNPSTGILSLTGNGVTNDQWQTALRSVLYNNISDNPTTNARVIRFRATDNCSVTGHEVTRPVNIVAAQNGVGHGGGH